MLVAVHLATIQAMRPLLLAVALLLVTGCAPSRYAIDGAGRLWVPEDDDSQATAFALSLVAAEGYDPEEMTVRRSSKAGRWLSEIDLGFVKVPLPNLAVLLGWNYEPRYRLLRGQNALVIMHRGRGPTVVPLDPDRPIGVEPETDERVWQEYRRQLERDLRAIEPEPPRPPRRKWPPRVEP